MIRLRNGVFFLGLFSAVTGMAQPPAENPGGRRRPPWNRSSEQDPMPGAQASHFPMGHSFHHGPPGRWWTDLGLVQKLGLTPDQQKRIDELFQQNRLKLIDLSASLQKEEVILEPLLSVDRPEESKILTQIDRIAQARAELEKANARMLLGFRNVLSPDQWKKIHTEGPRRRPER